jgi:Spy/CpxP family protein refolding chaperone
MRKLLISAALATATITAAVPAAAMAQPYGWQNRHGVDRGQISNLIRDLNVAEARINRAVGQRRDGISFREATGLRREAQNIRLRLNLAMRNGINQREFFDLRTRVNRLEARVRLERNDRYNRRF